MRAGARVFRPDRMIVLCTQSTLSTPEPLSAASPPSRILVSFSHSSVPFQILFLNQVSSQLLFRLLQYALPQAHVIASQPQTPFQHPHFHCTLTPQQTVCTSFSICGFPGFGQGPWRAQALASGSSSHPEPDIALLHLTLDMLNDLPASLLKCI